MAVSDRVPPALRKIELGARPRKIDHGAGPRKSISVRARGAAYGERRLRALPLMSPWGVSRSVQ